jgi:hypothetical protein
MKIPPLARVYLPGQSGRAGRQLVTEFRPALPFHHPIIAVELLYHVKKQILACVTIENYGYIYNLETARLIKAAEKGDGYNDIYKFAAKRKEQCINQ